jgi:hypothetical protein
MMIDTVIGVIIAGTLGLILVVAITQATRAGDRIDDGAAAVRLAQRAIAIVQQQGHMPAPGELGDATAQLKPITLDGRAWVEVTVTYHGRTATLIGPETTGGAR